MFYPKKTIRTPWHKTAGKIVFEGLDKDKNEIHNLRMPAYTKGQPVSVGFVDKHSPCGYNYERAFVLSEIPTKEHEMGLVKVSFGRKSKRQPMVLPFTSIHAACLASKRTFPVGA